MNKRVVFIEPRGKTTIEINPDTGDQYHIKEGGEKVSLFSAGPEVSATITIMLQRHINKLPSQWTEATVLRKSNPLGSTILTVFKTEADNVYLLPLGLDIPIAVKGTYQQIIETF